MAMYNLPSAVRLQLWMALKEARGPAGSLVSQNRSPRLPDHAVKQARKTQRRKYATVQTADHGKTPETGSGDAPVGHEDRVVGAKLMEAGRRTKFWKAVRAAVSSQSIPEHAKQKMLQSIETSNVKVPARGKIVRPLLKTFGQMVQDHGFVGAVDSLDRVAQAMRSPHSASTLSTANTKEEGPFGDPASTHSRASSIPPSGEGVSAPIEDNDAAASSTLVKLKRYPSTQLEEQLSSICHARGKSLEVKKPRWEWKKQEWVCLMRVKIGRATAEVKGRGPNKATAKELAWHEVLDVLNAQDPLGEPAAAAVQAQTAEGRAAQLAAQYPHAPATLFEPHNTAAQIEKQLRKLQLGTSGGKSRLTTEAEYLGNGEYELKIDIPGLFEGVSTGTGKSKVLAKHNAWANALIQLHEKDALRQLFSDPAQPSAFSQSLTGQSDMDQDEDIEVVKVEQHILQREKNALVDIWNYAARYGLVPQIEMKTIRRRLIQRRTRPAAKLENLVKVTIALPQHGISVRKFAKEASVAEVAATVAFKHAAEEQKDVIQGQRDTVPKGFEALSTETASQFVAFYRSRNPDLALGIESEAVNVGSQTRTKATVAFNEESIGLPAIMRAKKDAETVAYLSAAVTIATKEPELLEEFAERIKTGTLQSTEYVRPVTVPIGNTTLNVMQDTVVKARKAGLPDFRESLVAEDSVSESRGSRRNVSSWVRDNASERQLDALRRFEEDPELEKLRNTRAGLPMSQHSAQVLELISGNLYSIVIGATGSGKTTQVPQIILDDAIRRGEGGWCDIVCTQPRRLAASSVAQRVATERNESIPGTVGYQVRGDSRVPRPGGSITYCTTGLLLEQLKNGVDGVMDNVSHLIIDEVHERDIFVDFLLIVLKKAIKLRQAAGKKVPKVILMSATLDEKLFSQYLPNEVGGKPIPCPSLAVPGRTFPVKETYLEQILDELKQTHGSELNRLTVQIQDKGTTTEYLDAESAFAGAAGPAPVIDWKRKADSADPAADAIAAQQEESLVPIALFAAAIARICSTTSPEGAILTFLPGLSEIQKTQDMLLSHSPFGIDFADPGKFRILTLHSSVPPEQQRVILEPVPTGVRKIILSTNIAETSVTVPDVKHVVDLGKSRETRYDQVKRITELQTVWASSSNVRQRAGRAGRVSDGNYYALYSRERRQAMSASGLPELLRSDLQETALSIKARGFPEKVADFLAEAIEPPPETAVTIAVSNLKAIEAFTEDESLTSLGRVLSRLPIHPALGKMVLLGIVFRCLDPMITIGSMSAERSLFVNPPDMRAEANRARAVYKEGESDHLAYMNAFNDIRAHVNRSGQYEALGYARSMFVHFGAYRTSEQTARLIERALVDAQLIPQSFPSTSNKYRLGGEALNENSDNKDLIKCLLVAGFHPNIALRRAGDPRPLHRTATEKKVMIHPSSTNYGPRSKLAPKEDNFYTYGQLARSVSGDSLFMRDTTLITPMMAILFGGRLKTNTYRTLEMDDWLPFRVNSVRGDFASRLTLEFRKAKDRMLNEAFRSLSDPEKRLADDEVREIFARGLVKLLDVEDEGTQWAPPSWNSWGRKQAGGMSLEEDKENNLHTESDGELHSGTMRPSFLSGRA